MIAPDMVGFGYSDRPENIEYSLQTWADQVVGLMDTLGIEKASLVGNSFGGSIALRVATQHPDRVDKLVLMGSMGVPFPITEGLDAVWGYEPSFENMRKVLDYFAYSRELVNDELAQVRYEGSIQPGFQEAFSAMFPAPRQRWVEAMCTPEDEIRKLPHRTLIVHGREDQVIPVADLAATDGAHRQRRPVGVLALRALVDDRAHRRLQPRPDRVLLQLRKRNRYGNFDQVPRRSLRLRRWQSAIRSCSSASTRRWCKPGPWRTGWWPCTSPVTCWDRCTPATGMRRSRSVPPRHCGPMTT